MDVRIRDYEGDNYAAFWQGKGKENLNRLEMSIVRQLLPEKGNWLVDLGCGFGRFSDLYVNNYDRIVLVDYSLSLLRQAQTKCGGRASYVAANIYHLPFKHDIFDAALMVRVFHHLSAPRLALEEIRRILREHGIFIFNFSNKRNLARIGKYGLGLSKIDPFSTGVSEYGHLNLGHHPQFVAKLLEGEQFVVRASLGAGVIDKLVDLLPAKVAHLMPTGELLALVLGKVLLGPLVFWRAELTARKDAKNNRKQYSGVAEILMCPVCQGGLDFRGKRVTCINCGRVYEVVDGIFDLRVGQ